VLLCHALRRDRAYLYAHPEEELSGIAWIHYGRYLHERLAGKPTQYITGCQEFYGRPFRLTPAVLIPRPETEHVIEAALERAPPFPLRLLDVGTGSGTIAVTLSLELRREAFASDVSLAALEVARLNSRRLLARVHFAACDLGAAFPDRSFGLIVSNPPYIAEAERESLPREVRDWEPPLALYGGPGGAEILDRLVLEAERLLLPGGWLVAELAGASSEPRPRLLAPPWREAVILPDLAGRPRVLAARRA
jgi:release factor glutamine methyltransferase